MLVDVVSIACSIFFAILALFVLGKIIWKLFKNRKEAIAYVRSFKKGKCIIVLFPVFALYWVGLAQSGFSIPGAFFASIERTLGFLVMKYDLEGLEGLMGSNDLYQHTIYAGMLLVLLNALLFVFSWIGQYLVCWLQSVQERWSHRDCLVLLGNTPENLTIYHSDSTRRKLLLEDTAVGNPSERKKEREKLYMDGVAFRFTGNLAQEIQKRIRWAKKWNKECVIVVNTGDEKRNLAICKNIVEYIGSEADKTKTVYQKLKVYVFGDPRYETLYTDTVKQGKGCVHYLNKYFKVAMDFIDRYPFTRFMDEQQIDYATSLIKPKVNINAVMVGFGRANQQIFLTSVANNQFLTGTPESPQLKPVDYLIVDKDYAENNKNLNHSYFRYKKECCDHRGNFILPGYLAPPDLPAQETFRHWNINDRQFYNELKNRFTRNADDVNFVIIAFGTDLENLDLAQKLVEKRREWCVKNLTIFVKVRAWHKEETFLQGEDCYFFGHEKETVYNINKITNDKIFRMSQERDVFYKLAKESAKYDGAQFEQLRNRASSEWHVKKNQIERESSLYCCLSLRSKLQLMGLDYCTEQELADLHPYHEKLQAYEQTAYWEKVDKDDMPCNSAGEQERPVVSFADLSYPQSRRKTMAIHEHLRWNSFMITKGMIPASIAQIQGEADNGKNYALRRHGNLTTFDGLVAFRNIVADRDVAEWEKAQEQKPTAEEKAKKRAELEANADVIKYDYQILDDAYWLLCTQGYRIVDKKELEIARKNRAEKKVTAVPKQ